MRYVIAALCLFAIGLMWLDTLRPPSYTTGLDGSLAPDHRSMILTTVPPAARAVIVVLAALEQIVQHTSVLLARQIHSRVNVAFDNLFFRVRHLQEAALRDAAKTR
jgi:hypothetical protein